MPTIEQVTKQLVENCPLLKNEEFLRKHPGISGVVGFLDEAARTSYRIKGEYVAYDRLGVDNTQAFLELVQQDNSKAVKLYSETRDLFGF